MTLWLKEGGEGEQDCQNAAFLIGMAFCRNFATTRRLASSSFWFFWIDLLRRFEPSRIPSTTPLIATCSSLPSGNLRSNNKLYLAEDPAEVAESFGAICVPRRVFHENKFYYIVSTRWGIKNHSVNIKNHRYISLHNFCQRACIGMIDSSNEL